MYDNSVKAQTILSEMAVILIYPLFERLIPKTCISMGPQDGTSIIMMEIRIAPNYFAHKEFPISRFKDKIQSSFHTYFTHCIKLHLVKLFFVLLGCIP